MQLEEAKKQFIAAWGTFSSNWGINRTMAQIHALLLVSACPVSADDVIRDLNISRGNANMNLRDLINWGLVSRVVLPGERREYFVAEKDIFKVARIIARERKKRELEPMLQFLQSISEIEGDKNDPEIKTYTDTLNGIRKFGEQTDRTLDKLVKAEETWFWGAMIQLLA
jgi:DNA-binding transcriptional regulator GbsR (MarR family)